MASILETVKDLTSGFSFNIFKKTGESVVGIDIGSSSIKVVQLKRKHGVMALETYGELALGPYAGVEVGRAVNLSPERIAEALVDLLREANVTTKQCGVAMPFSASLISLVEMPPLDQKTLAETIPLEARKYIPVPINEVELDWFVIPEGDTKFFTPEPEHQESNLLRSKNAKPKSQVLLVAIHKNALAKYHTIIEKAGLTPSFYEIEIFSTIRAAMERTLAPVVILDMGAATTKLYVVEFGIIRSSHIINKGSQEITLSLASSLQIPVVQAEERKREFGLAEAGSSEEGKNIKNVALLTLEYIFGETQRTILAYEKQHGKSISKVILTGGGAALRGLLELAKKNLDTEVVLGDPFTRSEAPAFLAGVLKDAGPTFTVSFGLAARWLKELG